MIHVGHGVDEKTFLMIETARPSLGAHLQQPVIIIEFIPWNDSMDSRPWENQGVQEFRLTPPES